MPKYLIHGEEVIFSSLKQKLAFLVIYFYFLKGIGLFLFFSFFMFGRYSLLLTLLLKC